MPVSFSEQLMLRQRLVNKTCIRDAVGMSTVEEKGEAGLGRGSIQAVNQQSEELQSSDGPFRVILRWDKGPLYSCLPTRTRLLEAKERGNLE